MSRVITRDIICDYINFAGYSKDDLCKMINRWKRLLVTKYGAKKGTTIGIGIFDVTPDHVALLFATAEIGMVCSIISKPISMETVMATKFAQLGLPEIMVVDQIGGYWWVPEMVDYYRSHGMKIIEQIEAYHDVDDTDIECEPVYPHDNYMLTSTSGSTGKVKEVYFTHEYTLKWSDIAQKLRYNRETTVMHNVNMHHAAALTSVILPALRVVENNYYGLIQPGKEEQYILDYVIGRGVKTMMANNQFQINRIIPYIEKHKDKFTHKLQIFTAGFAAFDEMYDYAKRLPVTFWTCYGTTEQGLIAWFEIDDTTENVPGYVGELVDWITIRFDGDDAYATSEQLEFYDTKVPDKIRIEGNSVYFVKRSDKMEIEDPDLKKMLDEQCDYYYGKSEETGRKYIVLWDLTVVPLGCNGELNRAADAWYILNKEEFTVENKIAYGELLMYLDRRFEKENVCSI